MKERYILTLADCFLIPLDLPPLNRKETLLAAEAKLPGLYPLPLDDTVKDIIRNESQCCLYIMKRDRLNQIRKEGGRSIRISSTAQCIPRQQDQKRRIFYWSSQEGHDLYILKGNRIEQALHISAGQSLSFLISSLYPNEHPIMVDLRKEGPIPKNRQNKKRIRSLFPVHRVWLTPMLLSLFPVAVFSALLCHSYLSYQTLKADWEKNSNQPQAIPISPVTEYPWEDVQRQLYEALPRDYYTFLEILYSCFKGRAEILTLVIQEDELQLEAIGIHGLMIMKDLERSDKFHQLTLHQLQMKGTDEYFSLTGKLK